MNTFVQQEGGDHYSRRGGQEAKNFQHWDLVAELRLNYFVANATKYIMRWRDKNGIQDLKKALTYVDKLIALVDSGKCKLQLNWIQRFEMWWQDLWSQYPRSNVSQSFKIKTLRMFNEIHSLGMQEAIIMELLIVADCPETLDWAKKRLQAMIQFESTRKEAAAELDSAATPAYVNQ